jgi:hypothetical protein
MAKNSSSWASYSRRRSPSHARSMADTLASRGGDGVRRAEAPISSQFSEARQDYQSGKDDFLKGLLVDAEEWANAASWAP